MEETEDGKGLRDRLETAEQNATKAAELGKMLLEQNDELNEKLDEQRKQYDKRLELAEQEKYELQMRLDAKLSMEEWYNEEITHLRNQQAEGHDNLRQTLESEKHMEVSKLTRQIEELRADIDQHQCTEISLRQKNVELEELLQEQLNQTEVTHTKSFSNSEELNLLQEEVASLQSENTGLKTQLIEKKSEIQACMSECEIMKGKLVSRDEELDDVRCQFTSVNNALEHARMEKLDLKCQLDALRMETSGHKKKGNSIFSEVEDRRVEAEKKLISLQVRVETLKEKYNVEKQQNHKYKRQISQLLLQMSSGKVDNEYVNDLEAKLTQARQEIRELMEEMKQLQEKQEGQVKVMNELNESNKGSGDPDYVQYLITIINGKEKELQKIKEELRVKTLQLLDEKSRTSTQDSKIIQIEAEKDKLRSHNMNIAMKLEELKLKYDPESVKKSGTLVIKRTEKIPVDEPDAVKITETSRLHDNSSIKQSRTSLYLAPKKQVQPLAENQTNNLPNGPITKKKGKTVSISDEVEEHEIESENTLKEDESQTESTGNKPKGTRLTTVKHISKDSKHVTKNVNDCKTQ